MTERSGQTPSFFLESTLLPWFSAAVLIGVILLVGWEILMADVQPIAFGAIGCAAGSMFGGVVGCGIVGGTLSYASVNFFDGGNEPADLGDALSIKRSSTYPSQIMQHHQQGQTRPLGRQLQYFVYCEEAAAASAPPCTGPMGDRDTMESRVQAAANTVVPDGRPYKVVIEGGGRNLIDIERGTFGGDLVTHRYRFIGPAGVNGAIHFITTSETNGGVTWQ